MTHPSEDDLILHGLGEAADGAALGAHLAACAECRARQAGIQRVLAMVDEAAPARPAEYGAQVWWRLQPKLRRRPPARRLAPWLGMAAALLVAFLTGREFPRQGAQAPAAAVSEPARERILLSAVGDHLERSQRVLQSAAHAEEASELRPARAVAEDLVLDNRLFRQTALRSGEPALAEVLDDLERLLVELARSEGQRSPDTLKAFQTRVDGILFKVRVLGTRVRERERESSGVRPGAVS